MPFSLESRNTFPPLWKIFGQHFCSTKQMSLAKLELVSIKGRKYCLTSISVASRIINKTKDANRRWATHPAADGDVWPGGPEWEAQRQIRIGMRPSQAAVHRGPTLSRRWLLARRHCRPSARTDPSSPSPGHTLTSQFLLPGPSLLLTLFWREGGKKHPGSEENSGQPGYCLGEHAARLTSNLN